MGVTTIVMLVCVLLAFAFFLMAATALHPERARLHSAAWASLSFALFIHLLPG